MLAKTIICVELKLALGQFINLQNAISITKSICFALSVGVGQFQRFTKFDSHHKINLCRVGVRSGMGLPIYKIRFPSQNHFVSNMGGCAFTKFDSRNKTNSCRDMIGRLGLGIYKMRFPSQKQFVSIQGQGQVRFGNSQNSIPITKTIYFIRTFVWLIIFCTC